MAGMAGLFGTFRFPAIIIIDFTLKLIKVLGNIHANRNHPYKSPDNIVSWKFFLFQVLLKEAHHVLSVSHTPRKKSARVCVICEHRVLILKEPYPHASTTRLSDFYRVEFPKDKRET